MFRVFSSPLTSSIFQHTLRRKELEFLLYRNPTQISQYLMTPFIQTNIKYRDQLRSKQIKYTVTKDAEVTITETHYITITII
jgi:hypothetical protein